MNLFKSIFISHYMMALMGLVGYSGWSLYHGSHTMPWLGVLLTSLPILAFIMYAMILKGIARTTQRLPIINGLGAIGVAMSVWYGNLQHQSTLLVPSLATLSYTSFLIYSFWYSSFGRKPSSKIRVGQVLPSFSVTNASGTIVKSTELTGKPSILIFYRGNWCPLCMAQIKELVAKYKDIQALGVRIALISPQPHSNTVELAQRFDVPFDFLTDQGSKAAKALGINQAHGLPMGMQMMGYDSETVLPTVIITDANGKILWAHETDNYRVRPEPETYIEVLKAAKIGFT